MEGYSANKKQKHRLFAATFLSADQKRLLADIMSGQKDKLTKLWKLPVSLVKAEKLHLTWIFLGAIETEKIEEIAGKLNAIAMNTRELKLDFDQTEFWPNSRQSRLLVLASSHPSQAVLDLSARIHEALSPYQKQPAHGHSHFKPHITLMRLKPEDGHRARQEKHIPDYLPLHTVLPLQLKIKSLTLVESELGSSKDKYKDLEDFPLSKALT